MTTQPAPPQKIGILGDLHSNLSALEAVYSLLELEGITDCCCVGDLVGYGPRPNEVISFLREKRVRCVLGNHDYALLGRIDARFFNSYAREAIAWTKKRLSRDNYDWLDSLSLRYDTEDYSVFHAALPNPAEFAYMHSEVVARNTFLDFVGRVGFCGHTHVPLNYELDENGRLECHFKTNWVLPKGGRAIVNVGSVGQPRDENAEAPVMIYNSSTDEIRLLRTLYNIPLEQKLIRKAGLPRVLGERLTSGL